MPINVEVDGARVVYTVAHRGEDLAYPLLVDPEVTAGFLHSYGYDAYSCDPYHWGRIETDSPSFKIETHCGTIAPWGLGMYVTSAQWPTVFPLLTAGEQGLFEYQTRGLEKITRAYSSFVMHSMGNYNNDCMVHGIAANGGGWEGAWNYNCVGMYGAPWVSTSAGSTGNKFLFGTTVATTTPHNGWDSNFNAYMRDVEIRMWEDDLPYGPSGPGSEPQLMVPAVHPDPITDPSQQLSARALDRSTGIASLTFHGPPAWNGGTGKKTVTNPTCNRARCGRDFTGAVAIGSDMPNGTQHIRVEALDAAGNVRSTSQIPVRFEWGPIVQIDAPSGWTEEPTATVAATAASSALGIRSLALDGPAGWTAPHRPQTFSNATCTSATCPRTVTVTGSVGGPAGGLPEGESTLTATAAAPGMGPVSVTRVVRVDRSPPELTVDGIADDAYYPGDPVPVSISATDGVAGSAATRRSGVTRIEVYVDGGLKADTGVVPCTDGGSSCARSLSWTYDPDDHEPGEQEIRVVATDAAGNQATTVLEVLTPTPRAWPESDDPTFEDDDALLSGPLAALAATYPDRRDEVVWGLAESKPKPYHPENERLASLDLHAARITSDYAVVADPFALDLPPGCADTDEACYRMDATPSPKQAPNKRTAAGRLWRLDKTMKRLCPLQGGQRTCRYQVMVAFEPVAVACREPGAPGTGDECPPNRISERSPSGQWSYYDTPTPADYRNAVERFMWRYPFVKQYTAWNEPNAQGRLPDKPRVAAEYYNMLRDLCQETGLDGLPRCTTAIAGDFLDYGSNLLGEEGTWKNLDGTSNDVGPNGEPIPANDSYIERYLRFLDDPVQVWGLHPYESANDIVVRRFEQVVEALGGPATTPIWLTEVGGILNNRGAPPYPRNVGERRGARAIQHITSNPDSTYGSDSQEIPSTNGGLVNRFPRIKRVYFYSWRGDHIWDTGLMTLGMDEEGNRVPSTPRDMFFCVRYTTAPDRSASAVELDRQRCNGQAPLP
ncbi:MAG TPA: hypothetical protein VIL49_01390 [Capillimicrobium sp.]